MTSGKILSLLITILLLANVSHAQVSADSVMESQLDRETDSIISTTRDDLEYAVASRNRQKVRELQQQLNTAYEQSNYIALFPIENLLLYYWLGDYDSVLLYSTKIDTLDGQSWDKISPQAGYDLYSLLRERVVRAKNRIVNGIFSSTLSDEQKDFLIIYLEDFLLEIQGDSYSKTQLDTMLRNLNVDKRKFALAYPNSAYTSELKVEELEWDKAGLTLGIGIGFGDNTNQLAANFTNPVFAAMNIGGSHKQLVIELNLHVGGFSSKKDIVNQNEPSMVWKKGGSAIYFSPSLIFGYRAFEKSRTLITPFAGVGVSIMGANTGGEDAEFENAFTYVYGPTIPVGVHFDFRLDKMKKAFGHDILRPSFPTLRLSYAYNYQTLFRPADKGISGNMHTMTLTIQLFDRSLRSVKK